MKRLKRTLISLLMIALVIVLTLAGIRLHRAAGLLQRAGLPLDCVRGIVATDSFTDFLGYVDGYEWVILRVDPDRFTPPEGWTAAPITLAEAHPDRHPFARSFSGHEALPETFSAYHITPIDPGLPFEEREWLCFLYDGQGTLALYRGFLLYGF